LDENWIWADILFERNFSCLQDFTSERLFFSAKYLGPFCQQIRYLGDIFLRREFCRRIFGFETFVVSRAQ